MSLKRESLSHESFRNLVESSRYGITFALDSHVRIATSCLALSVPVFYYSLLLTIIPQKFFTGSRRDEGGQLRGPLLMFKFSLGSSLADTAC